MKLTFTLCAAHLISVTFAFGQATTENFETVTDRASLEDKCWQFTGVNSQPTITNTTIDNQYNVADVNASPLPITLKSFQYSVLQEKTLLNWVIADNETASFFEVERSTDGKAFKTISIVTTTQNAGDEDYSIKVKFEGNNYYRLKIVSNNKSVSYSEVLFINKQAASNNTLNLLQNPVKETLRFSFVSEANALTEVSVYNMLGVKVYKTTFQALKGANLITTILDDQIKGGNYLLEVKNMTKRSIAKFLKD